jgi:hypothetical protein
MQFVQAVSVLPESRAEILRCAALSSLFPFLIVESGQPQPDELRLHQASLRLMVTLVTEEKGQDAVALSLGALRICLRFTSCIQSPKAQEARRTTLLAHLCATSFTGHLSEHV